MLNHTLNKVNLSRKQLISINIPTITLYNIIENKLIICTQNRPMLKLYENCK
jgi:hypothetical protein